jgi:hypothetical protein
MMFVENRAWLLGTIFEIEELKADGESLLWNGNPGKFNCNDGSVEPTTLSFEFHVQTDFMPYYPDEMDPNCVRLIPADTTLSAIKPWVELETGWQLTAFRLNYHQNGFLNTVFVFDVPDKHKGADFESEAMEICGGTGRFEAMYKALFETLRTKKIISNARPMTFGKPTALNGEKLLFPEDTAYYCSHFFLSNKETEKLKKQLIEALALSNSPVRLDGGLVYPGDASYVWESESEWTINRVYVSTEVQFLTLAESAAYGIGAYLYTLILRRIYQNRRSVKTTDVRDLMDMSNYMVQAIKAQCDYLNEQQKACFVEFSKKSDIPDYISRYERAEKSLDAAVAGLSAGDARRSEIIIQTILISFSALTAYSVLNDVVSYISDLDKPLALAWSARSKIILVMTGLIAVVCLIAAKAIRGKR